LQRRLTFSWLFNDDALSLYQKLNGIA
jgi:hypothetical protein